jgi:hypothetical protein
VESSEQDAVWKRSSGPPFSDGILFRRNPLLLARTKKMTHW